MANQTIFSAPDRLPIISQLLHPVEVVDAVHAFVLEVFDDVSGVDIGSN
jgi:hypothetical protein